MLDWTPEELYRVPPLWSRIDLTGAALLVGFRRVPTTSLSSRDRGRGSNFAGSAGSIWHDVPFVSFVPLFPGVSAGGKQIPMLHHPGAADPAHLPGKTSAPVPSKVEGQPSLCVLAKAIQTGESFCAIEAGGRMSEAYIGVDVGTLSARAGVFDSAGWLIASARRPIAIWREPGEIVEQSSDDIWRAATSAVREAVEAPGLPPGAVGGMGFDATCSLVALDRNARPPSVSPTDAPERDVIDHRAVDDAERINAGGHETLRYVGGRISPEMHAPKLAWLGGRKPETIANAAHFFDLTDFLSFRATGSLTRSACPATCKFGYLAHESRWPDEFFDTIGLGFHKEDHYARIGVETAPPGAPLGRGLTAEAAVAMALRPGTPVGAGLTDAHAGAAGTLGARADDIRADPHRRLALILGTSSSCMALSDEPRFVDRVWGPHFGALTPDKWLIDGGQSAFGGAIDHLLRLHPVFAELSTRAGPQALQAIEKDIVARAGGLSQAALIAEGLHVLPDFIGRGSPWPTRARGAGAVAACTNTMASAMSSMSTIAAGVAAPAGGRSQRSTRESDEPARRCATPSERFVR
jgi:FGGY-family pentulose kinase